MNPGLFVLIVLLTFSMAYYVVFVLALFRGLGRIANQSAHNDSQFVSVVIAARNEASTITECVESLCQQQLPLDTYEVIVVDDGSTDGTLSILQSLRSKFPPLQVLSIEGNGSGKPAALARGIRASKGDIILTTDADCLVQPNWIRSMGTPFVDDTAFVAGPVMEKSGSSLLQRLSALEYFSLTATAAGLIGIGRPIICSGANLSFRKSVFEAAGGYGEGSHFCDDETLMQRIITRKLGKVRFVTDHDSLVITKGPSNLREFFHQRSRWAAKRGSYEDKSLLLLLVLLYSPFLLLFTTFFAAWFYPILFLPMVSAWLIKSGVDYFVLKRARAMFDISFSRTDFLIAELLHVPYIVTAALFGQVGHMRWKGRTL